MIADPSDTLVIGFGGGACGDTLTVATQIAIGTGTVQLGVASTVVPSRWSARWR